MTIDEVNRDNIERAARVIGTGGLVAMPTETVYGLAADATNGRAVAGIYSAKGRPRFNPLIVHVASVEAARALIVMTPMAERLAAAFWPGPLTLVLRARAGNGLADLATAGLDTVAVRVPGHPVALALLAACKCPLAAPSANTSGRISPTTAEHVAADFGNTLGMILNGGACDWGLESTIVACEAAPAQVGCEAAPAKDACEAAPTESPTPSPDLPLADPRAPSINPIDDGGCGDATTKSAPSDPKTAPIPIVSKELADGSPTDGVPLKPSQLYQSPSVLLGRIFEDRAGARGGKRLAALAFVEKFRTEPSRLFSIARHELDLRRDNNTVPRKL